MSGLIHQSEPSKPVPNSIPLDPLPASTGIQAKLCRSDLLVEIEAVAMFRKGEPAK